MDQLSIDYLERKILEHKKNNKENYDINKSLSLSDISRLCYSIKVLLKNKGFEFKDIPKTHIIDFIYELLFTEKDIKIKDNKIKDILLQSLIKEIKKKNNDEKKQNNNDENNQKNNDENYKQNKEKFIFKNSPSLENYLSIVYASFLINLHLCIIGPPGVGKTSSAKFISEILEGKENNYIFFPFHRNTKISELYGTLNLKEEVLKYYNGPLIESVQKGCIFIADEMNLSSIPTMKSIAPFLDTNLNKNILLPGLDKPIDIDPNFFFIVCQNDLDNLGRNSVPEKLQRKLRNISYPEQTNEEIKDICKQKRNKDFGNNKESDLLFSEAHAESLGEFMKEYNKIIDKYKLPLLKWSFRDIDKIIKRISKHLRESQNYKNFHYYHTIYFYLLSPIPMDYFDKKYNNNSFKDIIHSLFIKVFHLQAKSDELIQNYFDNKPKVDLNNNFLMKGNIGIKFDNLKEMIKEEHIFEEELSNYYNDLFKLKLISNEEPVLLMGPSSYKTHLSKYFIYDINGKDFSIINLNQKTTIEELLGCSHVLPPNSYIFFYDLLKKILKLKDIIKSENKNDIKEDMNNIKDMIDSYKGAKKEILNNLYNHMDNNIKKLEKNNKENINSKKNNLPQLVFKPGSILLSILKEESLIFKDIHQVSTEIFERFNELFGTERILSLKEDIYGTLFNNSQEGEKDKKIKKIIDLKSLDDNIYIIATCPENSFQSLSDSVVSRFSVICVGEHDIKAKENIIGKYSKKFNILKEETIQKKIREFLHENNNINKLKNLFDIFDEMNKNNINDINNNEELDKIYNNLNYAMHYIKLNNKFLPYNESSVSNIEETSLKDENNFLISKISNLKIFYQKNVEVKEEKEKKEKKNIVFTPVFNEMLDLLHFGICTRTPIILEGLPGQGKRKVIYYISEKLNYDVENIVITNNFSVDDLYKKTSLESNDDGIFTIEVIDTKLNKILNKLPKYRVTENYIDEEQNKQKPILFVFHNIQKARADVLSEISNIFNKKCVGTNYCFIGIINYKESFIERKYYYYNYFFNSIYYIVYPTNIDNLFCKKYCKGEDIDFSILNYFKNEEDKEKSIFTLTDFAKFIALKEIPDDNPNKSKDQNPSIPQNTSKKEQEFLEEIVFENRYYRYRINKENKSSSNFIKQNKTFDFDIDYKIQDKKLLLKVEGKEILLKSSDILDNFEKEKNTLCYEQKKCLIVLGLAVKSKLPCILEGPTGVGKSHLIKLFAKMLGKNLHIINLNKDNDISLLTKRYVFKKYDSQEKNEIETTVNKLLENQEDVNKLNLKEKIKKLIESNLDYKKNEQKELENLKSKYKFIHRFKYEKSRMLKAVEEGEWVLLDGIENATASIIEKITLLCGDKPELNLYENGQNPIQPNEGFHLFMTYNSERINHNDYVSSLLLDKCLIYYLDSFINNEQSLSQIIDGFLVNSNYSTDPDLLSAISSRISNIHKNIVNNLGNDNERISERTIINFCKNLSLYEDKNNFPMLVKNNFLYFYFPSSDIEKFNQIINNYIDEKGIDFTPLAKNFRIECRESLKLIDVLEKNIINNQNSKYNLLGELIFSCLNIPFKYIEDIQKIINEVINKADKSNYKYNYLPLKTFTIYLEDIYKSFKGQEKIMNSFQIRKAIEFPKIRILLLLKKLYENGLLSWDCSDILYHNINFFEIFKKLLNTQNLVSLGLFFEQIILNIKYIKDIINIFPYSLFKETKFSLLNEIVSIIIKNTANRKINFKIKINDKKYHFKYTPNESKIITIILDLNLNDAHELIITKETKIIIQSINKKGSIPYIKAGKNEHLKLNRYFLMIIEKILNIENININTFSNIYKGIIKKLNDSSQSRFNSDNLNNLKLFKNKNNLVIDTWSIIYIIGDSECYLNNLLKNLENDIFKMFIYLRNEILIEPSNTFEDKLKKIINMSKDLYNILESHNIIVNLSNNKNYIDNIEFNSIEERKKIKNEIIKEIETFDLFIEKYNDFSFVKELFLEFRELLDKESLKLIKEINQLEISDFKKRIENKIKLGLSSSEKLKDSFLNLLNGKKTFEDLKEIDKSIDLYLRKYNNKNKEKMIYIFSEINISEKFLKDNKLNSNVKLIEILIKYSKIKDIINDISFNNKNNKILIFLKQLNEIVFPKYIDFFNSFLLKENLSKKDIDTIYNYIDAMLIQEIIYNNLVQNLIGIKGLLNNLYKLENYGKIDEFWCKNIERKYNLCSNIYLPKFNEKSFLYLFIKVKNFNMDIENGFLIDKDISDRNRSDLLNNIFHCLKEIYNQLVDEGKPQLIIDIGSKLIKLMINQNNTYFTNIDKLCQVIEDFIEKNKSIENEKFKIDILQNFLNAKELYLNYNNDEELSYDDIYNENNGKELFTKKYPSLLNYLNCNEEVYRALMEEPKIISFRPPQYKNSIPIWLICLRTLANSKNIKPFFEYNDIIIDKFEKEYN